MTDYPRKPNVCGRCGATRVEMYMTSVPSCVNREACALRVELLDVNHALTEMDGLRAEFRDEANELRDRLNLSHAELRDLREEVCGIAARMKLAESAALTGWADELLSMAGATK